jgi:hypothetical protein
MANQNNNQQNMAPVDPFSMLMWGPPPGAPPFMPMAQQNLQQPDQGQGQTQIQTQQGYPGGAMPGFFGANGNFDFNKLMDGADKMFKLINQTQPMIKQLGPLMNLFKR